MINKIGKRVFLDERARVLSHDSVDETSQHRPTTKRAMGTMNGWRSLAKEATYINNVFGEQMLFHSSLQYTEKLKWNHPFETVIKYVDCRHTLIFGLYRLYV